MTTVSNAKLNRKGAKIGYFDAQLDSGMKLNGLMLCENSGKRWVNFPSREWTSAEGEKSYFPIIEIPDRAARDRFNDLLVPLAVQAFGL
jgi:hypothetical protein